MTTETLQLSADFLPPALVGYVQYPEYLKRYVHGKRNVLPAAAAAVKETQAEMDSSALLSLQVLGSCFDNWQISASVDGNPRVNDLDTFTFINCQGKEEESVLGYTTEILANKAAGRGLEICSEYNPRYNFINLNPEAFLTRTLENIAVNSHPEQTTDEASTTAFKLVDSLSSAFIVAHLSEDKGLVPWLESLVAKSSIYLESKFSLPQDYLHPYFYTLLGETIKHKSQEMVGPQDKHISRIGLPEEIGQLLKEWLVSKCTYTKKKF